MRLSLCLAALALQFCAAQHTAALAKSASADERLDALFASSDRERLELDPNAALARGDLSRADRFPYDISKRSYRIRRLIYRQELNESGRINRLQLSATHQLYYDAFIWNLRIALEQLDRDHLRLTRLLPLDSLVGVGFQSEYADLSTGNGYVRYTSRKDYEDCLARHAQYPAFINLVIARLRNGMRVGVTHPKAIVHAVILQLDGQIGTDQSGKLFLGPVTSFPESVSDPDRRILELAFQHSISGNVLPALIRLRDFLQNEYLPSARSTIGLSALRGGARLYRFLIQQNTTFAYAPRQLHELGLREIARLHEEMEGIKRQVGYIGTLGAFSRSIQENPAMQAGTDADIDAEYSSLRDTIVARLPQQFEHFPKAKLELRQVPGHNPMSGTTGYFIPADANGSRPGVFYYKVVTTPTMDALMLHEAWPGHHFQCSLAAENTSLPAFLRFSDNSAYIEGWGLYAENLWNELGVETDPYHRYGGLQMQMERAVRLVVDTGIHAFNWNREKAIDYIVSTTGQDRLQAEEATDRYISEPATVLAYKVGELTLLHLKSEARARLGGDFDVRRFHSQILDTGPLPLAVLEGKISAWLQQQTL